jgi:chromosome segregation ATPase
MRDVNLEFGINAGKIWMALDSGGSLTKNQLMKLTNLNKDEFHGAVGWLSKENKIRKEGEFFRLDETNLNSKIEEDAWVIWTVLDTKKGNVNNLSKITHLNEDEVQTALGWLARDGKLDKIDDKNRINMISSEDNEINDLKDEINALKSDLATRNNIIKEITDQLTNNQTKLIENTDVVSKQKVKIDDLENNLISKTNEVNSAQFDIINLKDEINGLNEDLDTRNEIIKEITNQLKDRQTQFIESSWTIETLRDEINQNKNKMKLMSNKLDGRINNITDLQKELENNHTTLNQTESKLFKNKQPLVQPDSQNIKWDEFESINEKDSFEIIDKTQNFEENTLKNKKIERDEQ